jgi:hypothetical protein
MSAKLTCSVCRRANHQWRKFCGGCGTGFPGACKCGFVNGSEDRFCGACGSACRHPSRAKVLAGIDNVTTKIEILADVMVIDPPVK